MEAMRRLDEIESAAARTRAIATLADPLNDEFVVGRPKAVFPADPILQFREFVTDEFDNRAAFVANQVLVLGIAVVVFVMRARSEVEFAEQARLHENAKRTIDGRAADAEVLFLEAGDQFIRFEMLVLFEDVLDHAHPLAGPLEPLDLEKLSKFIDRGEADGNGWKIRGRPPFAAVVRGNRCFRG